MMMELPCSKQEFFLDGVKLQTMKRRLYCCMYKTRIMPSACKIIPLFAQSTLQTE